MDISLLKILCFCCTGLFSANVDEAIAITQQQKELLRYRMTKRSDSMTIRLRPGSRVLCLDGGGIRGLIQIEVLRQLEEQTGRKVTELFDWIVGTSTGGVVALGLVYGEEMMSIYNTSNTETIFRRFSNYVEDPILYIRMIYNYMQDYRCIA